MAAVTVFQSITLDGVMQAPGRADEDTRGGFRHGGWADGYQDDVSMAYAAESMARPGALLFGRRSYDDMLSFWTSIGPNPFVDVLVDSTKYVASHSNDTVLAYPNSRLLAGDAATEVAALKDRIEDDLTVMGSGELVRALHGAGLIDTYVLQIHPVVLGSGTRLFGDGDRVDMRLTRSMATTTGVIIAEYAALR